MKKVKFKPRNLNNEMPSLLLSNVIVSRGGMGGVHIEGLDNVVIDGLTTKEQNNPLVINHCKRVRANRLNFSR